LRESYRVTRRGGRMFVMSLTRAAGAPIRLLQRVLQTGGLKFPAVPEFNTITAAEGWTTLKQESKGIVLFTLLTKE
jgi:ubiquinone/menaquinone biosynthesis C-methylase UbiE